MVARQQMVFRMAPGRAFLISVCFVGLVGSVDELTQYFIPGRTGLALDVLLDLSGSIIAFLWLWKKSKTLSRLFDWR